MSDTIEILIIQKRIFVLFFSGTHSQHVQLHERNISSGTFRIHKRDIPRIPHIQEFRKSEDVKKLDNKSKKREQLQEHNALQPNYLEILLFSDINLDFSGYSLATITNAFMLLIVHCEH